MHTDPELPRALIPTFPDSLIDAYERTYPQGRYAAEMRLWRGAAAIDARQWETAVDLLDATLADATKPDLYLDAALNLADVFMRLLEPDLRDEVLTAIVANSSALQRLQRFMRSETLGACLAVLSAFLEEPSRLTRANSVCSGAKVSAKKRLIKPCIKA